MLTQTFNKQEPIPGYITKELLGTGGYGEVWKVNAPGGLVKAIKFISAEVNAKGASRELRSLNRIKEVRHPFLLSIERIEVIDGNVVIVTELADQSLKRHYQKQRAKGLPGIPRDELLGYLRDAADALDYIYDNYSLQHLDIKPENLLLIGNRAKVADFGLIKNLYDRSTSMVEGLTPVYAPPEIFEGKPNRHSDQYSLAIVFQEMLTGTVPFDGSSAAQLAAQHLHTAPGLSALAKFDQSIIARALSKDPAQRFANCRALVEALAEAGRNKQGDKREAAPVREVGNFAPAAGPCRTEELDDNLADLVAAEPAEPKAPKALAHLPRVVLGDDTPPQYEPVLFVGIGGAATHVLRRLHRRLHDRLGTLDSIPAIEMLLIDTDIKNLNRATDGEPGSALPADQRLPMPLRPSEDYRSSAGSILGSISRRWLYNVPLSLQTEGFRPLGRLALVDHFKRLRERLRSALVKVTSEENVARTAQTTGLEFASRQPRVFLIASTSGGTGGGMVLDVAYAVRTILSELDLPDGNVHGVLLHSTPRGPRGRDQAAANTYATLSELWHYSRPGHYYPGDRGCGLPAFHGNNRTFSSCYFVPLGDDLTDLQFDAATDPVAEYLFSNTVTPAAAFFDKCRQMEYVRWGTELTEPLLRTFGLCQLGGSNSDIPTVFAELICKDLVCIWRSGMPAEIGKTATLPSVTTALTPTNDRPNDVRFVNLDGQAEAAAPQLGIDVEQMTQAAREILEQELSSDIDAHLVKLITDNLRAAENKGDGNTATSVLAAIDAALVGSNGAALDSLTSVLNTRMEARAAKLATAVRAWIFDLVDAPDGVAGAKHAAEWFQSHLRHLQTTTAAAAGRLHDEALALNHAVLRQKDDAPVSGVRLWGGRKRPPDIKARLIDYALVQTEQAIGCSVTRCLGLIEAQVTAELDSLKVFWTDLNALAREFHVSESLEDAFDCYGDSELLPSHWRDLLGELIKRRRDLVTALDRAIEEKLGVGPHKLRWYLTESRRIDVQLAKPLRAAARQLILATMQSLNISRLCGNTEGPVESSDYRRCVEAARPPFADLAAGTRLLLVVPQDTDAAAVRRSVASDPTQDTTIVYSPGGDFIACQEAEQLEVRRVAAALIEQRTDFVELAQRLHTRIDVKWDDMASGGTCRN